MSQGDDPPYLSVGTDVSAKYKGAFCEAKISKVVRVLQLKVTYNGPGLGTGTVTDDQVRLPPSTNQKPVTGPISLRCGQIIQAKHPEKKEFINATITRIRDLSQYTVVFDDGDITTLRRTSLCLKSGRHFKENETLDQLPLTHPEHFGNPVVVSQRGRRSRQLKYEYYGDGEEDIKVESGSGTSSNPPAMDRDVGKVVCVETSEGKRKSSRDSNWFPGLVVAPTAQAAVRINTREEYLIRSFKDGRYYTVPRKEITEFKRDASSVSRVESPPLAEAVDKALNYLDNAELPQHWDKDTLFGLDLSDNDSEDNYSDSSDEPREEKDHFVAKLYKFMDDRNTPLNKGPIICNKDVDLCRMFRIVHNLGGYNSVTNKNKWAIVSARLGFTKNSASTLNLVKQAYYRFLFPFEEFNRKLGCTMLSNPRNVKKSKGRNLIRDRDRATPVQTSSSPKLTKPEERTVTPTAEKEKKEDSVEKEEPKKKIKKKEDVAKSKREVDASESSSSEGTADTGHESPVPVVKKVVETTTSNQKIKKAPPAEPKTPSTSSQVKRTKISGEKVKSLIEKFEEQKPDTKDEDKQTRSKSVLGNRKDSTASSPDRKGRDGRTSAQAGANNKFQKNKNGDEEKKRGRKRKEPDDKTQSSDSSVSDSPSVVVINVNKGDKLKVYYGPNVDSKVTYEAKVLDIDTEEIAYLVHYTGWNNRYDEWIKPHRIAENLSQNSKGKRLLKTTPKSSGNTTPTINVNRRGRGSSISNKGTSQEAQNTPPNQVRSTTPSSVTSSSSRTKSPTTPAARAPSARLAKQAENSGKKSTATILTRQTSTASESDSGNSDSEDVPKRRLLKRKEETPERVLTEDEGPPERPKRVRKTPKKSLNDSNSSNKTSLNETEPKGRDYDLNQIRSELKGFDKALKTPSTSSSSSTSSTSSTTTSNDNEISKNIIESKVVLNKTSIQDEIKKPEPSHDKEIKEVKEVKSIATDDIYEFKEPEPLELESRKLNDDKAVKKRRLLEDFDKVVAAPVEKISPTKKKPVARTPPKSVENKALESGDKKPRFRRNITKKSEENETNTVSEKSANLSGQKSSEVEDSNQRSRTISASEEAFEKLVVSPSYNIGLKTSPSSNDSIKLEKDNIKLESSESELTIKLEEAAKEDVKKESIENTSVNIKDAPSSVDNSDEDDPIHEAIRGIAESKDDDDDDSDNLLNNTFSAVGKFESNEESLIKKDFTKSFTNAIKTESISVSKTFNVTEVTTKAKAPEPTIKVEKSITTPKKEEKPSKPPLESSESKSISSTSVTEKSTEVLVEKKLRTNLTTTPKVETAKVKEDQLNIAKTNTTENERFFTSISSDATEKNILQPVNISDLKKRGPVKKTIVQEFSKDEESDSSDNDERLVIARSDDESQTSQGDSVTSNNQIDKNLDSVKSNDSNLSPLRINTEESSEESKTEDLKDDSQKIEDEPDSNIALLLCEETIPCSPSPSIVSGSTVSSSETKAKPVSAKNLDLEIPFASAAGSSKTLQVKEPVIKSPIDMKSKSISHQNLSTLAAASLANIVSVGSTLTTSSIIKSNIMTGHGNEEANDINITVENSAPSTPESSISNLSPRGDNGGSSPGTADESNKSHRGSEASELEQFSAVRVAKSQHFNDEDIYTFINNTDSINTIALDIRPKKNSPKSNNEDSQPANVYPTILSKTGGNRKRRISFKGDDAHINVPPVPNKRGRKPNALKNLKTTPVHIPSGINSDSDDTSEHSSATSAAATPLSTAPGISLDRLSLPRTNQKPSKYNFIVQLDPALDSNQRISILQQKLSELRKAYTNEKNELASIERRLKKIRRRMREASKSSKQEIACA